MLLDLAHEDTALKRVSSVHGGEYAGPCPSCGGTDRFRVWPETGRYWCRGCGLKGDAIQYFRDIRGMSFKEAAKAAGQEERIERQERAPAERKAPVWTPKPFSLPGMVWCENAGKLVIWAEAQLWGASGAEHLQWLHVARGLTDETIRAFRLGWNPKELYRNREAWGLPQALNDQGKPKKLWLPPGLVIPHFLDGHIVRVRFRRPEGEPKYILLPGSCLTPMQTGSGDTVVVVESELDAILLHQVAWDLATFIAMGSASYRPDQAAHELLIRAKRILVALDSPDTDEAGAKSAWGWWLPQYRQARRWPVIQGKDPTEAMRNGLDLRLWVQAGLMDDEQGEEAPRAPASEEHEADPSLPRVCHTTPAREAIAAEIRDLYQNMASAMDKTAVEALGPEWAARLRELERAFEAAWDQGGEPWDELGALKMHIRAGLHPYRCADCFLSDGCTRNERHRWGLMCRHGCKAFRAKEGHDDRSR